MIKFGTKMSKPHKSRTPRSGGNPIIGKSVQANGNFGKWVVDFIFLFLSGVFRLYMII